MNTPYGIRHHALLYALIVKYIFLYEDNDPEETVRNFTMAYGIKRGQRMRRLALENNEPLDISTFLVHGEWTAQKDENSSVLSSDSDSTYSTVHKCAWFDCWKKYGLLEYGTHYCRYIDKAICDGFDGDFSLDLEKAIGFGDKRCEFRWNRKYDESYLGSHPKKWILPFEFHCQELRETAYEVLDEKIRDKILDQADEQFRKIFNI